MGDVRENDAAERGGGDRAEAVPAGDAPVHVVPVRNGARERVEQHGDGDDGDGEAYAEREDEDGDGDDAGAHAGDAADESGDERRCDDRSGHRRADVYFEHRRGLQPLEDHVGHVLGGGELRAGRREVGRAVAVVQRALDRGVDGGGFFREAE